ncbi:alpha-L-rhamnosidase-related protein [Cellulomonas sp. Marseille-Q8402]
MLHPPAVAPVPATTGEILARARAAGPDVYPDDVPVAGDVTWHHRDGDVARGLLRHLVAEASAAHRYVDYPATGAPPAASVVFRFRATGDGAVRLSTSGPARLRTGEADRPLPALEPVVLTLRTGDVVELDVGSPDDGAAAVGVRHGSVPGAWTCRTEDTGAWAPTEPRRAGPLPPHATGEGVVEVPLTEVRPGLHAVPAPGLGRVVLRVEPAAGEPVVVTGETVAEATADPADGESRYDLDPRGDGTWATRHRLGFRYVSVRGVTAPDVRAELHLRAAPRRGAFVCDDDRLNRIWATGAFTLRSCLQGLLVDGIKRDRLPWAGDLALAVAPIAYGFGDAAVVRDSLRALGHPRTPHVNGIADYSLWWVVAHELHHRHWGDDAFLATQAPAVHDLLTRLTGETDGRGLLRPRPAGEVFPGAAPTGVFIDWGVQHEQGRDPTALQVLWWWALAAGARVLALADHPAAQGWAARADRLRPLLGSAGPLRTYVDGDSAPDPYATLLAVHAGLYEGAVPDGARRTVLGGTFGTPSMAALALRALTGEHAPAAVRRIADRWGAMLDAGALTFWEELPGGAGPDTAMYGRPFGRSLCHGWAAGPVAALPELVLGLRPTSAGWRTAVASPSLGDLRWAAAVVPVPGGDLAVTAEASGRVVVDVPDGHVLDVAGQRVAGPRRAELRVEVDRS